MRRLRVVVVLLLTAGLGLAVRGFARQTGRENPPLVIESLYGPDLYRFYCAPCHGNDGRGGGPVAVALKTVPPDLTGIAKRHGGVFPTARVEAFVTNRGEPVPAHGTVDMPVWGPTFGSLDPSHARVKVRIANLVAYLESIQAKRTP